MSSPLPLERLMHIRDEVLFLQRCRAKLPDVVALVADEVMSRAIVKSIQDLRNGNSETVFPGWKTCFQVAKTAFVSSATL